MAFLQKYPFHLFLLGILLHLLAVLLPSAFVTHDGPSHLYNAHIINQILFTEGSIYEQFHILNLNFLQPNLLGYVPLCLFQLFLPFLWAEKITVALYVLLFAFGFRYLLKQHSPNADWYALLIFPFVLNVVLFWGFFNFLIALGLSFYLLAYYERGRASNTGVSWLLLCLLSLIIFYSHALVFVFCGVYVLIREAHTLFVNRSPKRAAFFVAIRETSFLIPGAVLFLAYLIRQAGTDSAGNAAFDLGKRLSGLILNPEVLSFSGYSEGAYVVPLFLLLVVLGGIKLWQDHKNKTSLWSVSFLLMLFFFLATLFTPEEAGGGSVIVPRLNLVFFLFFLVWISRQELNRTVKWLIGIYLVFSLALLSVRFQFIQAGAQQCHHVIESSALFLEKNSLIGSIHNKPVSRFVGDYQIHTYFDIMTNIDLYAALDQGCLSLHNYEANMPREISYFPVSWRHAERIEVVRDPSHTPLILEYTHPDTLAKYKISPPEVLLCVGQSVDPSGGKAMWDPQGAYKQVFGDSIAFLRVYSRMGDIGK
ncbi:MAG TPA: hypothetical protein DIW47_03125 [Bacteroidetes bacterium]|nr:hypothetical protein [Bacteroidota bacterium]